MRSFSLLVYVVILLYSVFAFANETTGEGETTRQPTANYTMERREPARFLERITIQNKRSPFLTSVLNMQNNHRSMQIALRAAKQACYERATSYEERRACDTPWLRALPSARQTNFNYLARTPQRAAMFGFRARPNSKFEDKNTKVTPMKPYEYLPALIKAWQSDILLKTLFARAQNVKVPTPRRFGDDVQKGYQSLLTYPNPNEPSPPQSAADVPQTDENYCPGIYCANFRSSGNNKNNEFPMNRGSDAVEEQVQQQSPPVIILVRAFRGNSQTGTASDDVQPMPPQRLPQPQPVPPPPPKQSMSDGSDEPLCGVTQIMLKAANT